MNVIEISRIQQIGNLWTVQILSAATGNWIIQGEFNSKAAAQADLKNWR